MEAWVVLLSTPHRCCDLTQGASVSTRKCADWVNLKQIIEKCTCWCDHPAAVWEGFYSQLLGWSIKMYIYKIKTKERGGWGGGGVRRLGARWLGLSCGCWRMKSAQAGGCRSSAVTFSSWCLGNSAMYFWKFTNIHLKNDFELYFKFPNVGFLEFQHFEFWILNFKMFERFLIIFSIIKMVLKY